MTNILDSVVKIKQLEAQKKQFQQKQMTDNMNMFIERANKQKQINALAQLEQQKLGQQQGQYDATNLLNQQKHQLAVDKFNKPKTALEQMIEEGKAADAQMNIYKAGGPAPSLYNNQGLQNLPMRPGDDTTRVNMPATSADTADKPIPLEGAMTDDSGQQWVPKGKDEFGRITGWELSEPTAAQEKEKMGLQEGKRMSLSNINLVTGAVRELSQTYADAYEEGGVGNKLNEWKSDLALYAGGDIGDKFDDTAAFEGQKTEVVSRLMPLLTQQGDKPGSVRLVSTVFDKLEKTLPAKNSGPKSAFKMMEKTVTNMYRFARASQMLSITNESVEAMSDEQLETLSSKVADMADKIEIKGEEKTQLDKLISEALKPISDLSLQEFSSVEKANAANLPKGTRIRINGKIHVNK